MYFLQCYGYLSLYIDYPLMMPFYHTVVVMTHQNVINLLAVQLQMAVVIFYRDKHVSVQYILTHEAKHNKHTNSHGNLTFPEIAGSFAKIKRQGEYK